MAIVTTVEIIDDGHLLTTILVKTILRWEALFLHLYQFITLFNQIETLGILIHTFLDTFTTKWCRFHSVSITRIVTLLSSSIVTLPMYAASKSLQFESETSFFDDLDDFLSVESKADSSLPPFLPAESDFQVGKRQVSL